MGTICLKCLVWLIALFCRRRSRRKGLLLVLSMVVYEMKHLVRLWRSVLLLEPCIAVAILAIGVLIRILDFSKGVLARCIRTGYCDFEPEVLRTALVKTSEWVEEVCDENIGEERDSGYWVVFLVS